MSAKSDTRPEWWGSFRLGGVSTLPMILFRIVLKRWLPIHFAMGLVGFES
jgi:hypothetical protein